MRRRHHLSLADAVYVELARLDTVVVTTDHRLSRATPLAVAPPA
jgi:predicted nucleic acid-binding protein